MHTIGSVISLSMAFYFDCIFWGTNDTTIEHCIDCSGTVEAMYSGLHGYPKASNLPVYTVLVSLMNDADQLLKYYCSCVNCGF